MHLTKPGTRGCGQRVSGGLYMCVGLSPEGRPVEEFVIDPARYWKGAPFRSPIIVPRNDSTINDVLLWVGAESYPAVPDYVEEVSRMGISKRIPINFPVEQLTPLQSRMILIHPRAIPSFSYDVTPTGKCRKLTEHECTFNTWPLSLLLPPDEHRRHTELGDGIVDVAIGSIAYRLTRPGWPKESREWPYVAGAFFATTWTHLEFVDRDGNKGNAEVVQRARAAGIHVEIMEL